MNPPDEFLNPPSSATQVDLYAVRSLLLRSLKDHLPSFSGTVLDVGCGQGPYRPLLLSPPSRAVRYIGLDLPNSSYGSPDLKWDGRTMPLKDESVDCALATEVLEHCPEPEVLLGETRRVLKAGGLLFLTVPFLWPLHCVPFDEYRYTPFALRRHLHNAGFEQVALKALGGWDASLAQMIGLWARRGPVRGWRRTVFSHLAVPIVRNLLSRDKPPTVFEESCMITGIAGTARKPSR